MNLTTVLVIASLTITSIAFYYLWLNQQQLAHEVRQLRVSQVVNNQTSSDNSVTDASREDHHRARSEMMDIVRPEVLQGRLRQLQGYTQHQHRAGSGPAHDDDVDDDNDDNDDENEDEDEDDYSEYTSDDEESGAGNEEQDREHNQIKAGEDGNGNDVNIRTHGEDGATENHENDGATENHENDGATENGENDGATENGENDGATENGENDENDVNGATQLIATLSGGDLPLSVPVVAAKDGETASGIAVPIAKIAEGGEAVTPLLIVNEGSTIEGEGEEDDVEDVVGDDAVGDDIVTHTVTTPPSQNNDKVQVHGEVNEVDFDVIEDETLAALIGDVEKTRIHLRHKTVRELKEICQKNQINVTKSVGGYKTKPELIESLMQKLTVIPAE